MKQYTSRFLRSIGIVYLLFPLVHITAAAVLFDIDLRHCFVILLSPFYWVVSILAIIAGYGLRDMQRWSWYVLIATNLLVVYENAVISNLYGESHHKIAAFLASLAILIGITLRVGKEIRVPYFFPRIRWWESDPRYRLSVPVTVTRTSGEIIEGQIMDISTTGCFIKLRTELDIDEELGLSFSVFHYAVACRGNVVWHTQSTVTVPKGVGIKFGELGRVEKRHLRFITRRLKKMAVFYRRARYLLNQEEFMKRLNEIGNPHKRTAEKGAEK